MSWRHQMPKHELLNNFGSKQSGNEIWPIHVTLQNKTFYQKIIWKIQKFHFPIEVLLDSFQTQRGVELVFRAQFL